jgi:hypothetical protein
MLLLLALSWTGCSQSGQAEEGTPGAAVQTFYGHLGDGAYDDAQAMYSEATREIVADPEMFRSWADQATRQGSIEKVLIVDSKVAESQTTAAVEFELAFADGSTEAYSVELVDEGGAWKIGLVVPK